MWQYCDVTSRAEKLGPLHLFSDSAAPREEALHTPTPLLRSYFMSSLSPDHSAAFHPFAYGVPVHQPGL